MDWKLDILKKTTKQIWKSETNKALNPHHHSPGTRDQHMNPEGQTELQATLLKEKRKQ